MGPDERRSVHLFLAGFSGSLGVLFLLLSFGTDYWLLASETCGPGGSRGDGDLRLGEVQHPDTFFHQGLFWRCTFLGTREENREWLYRFTNQPHQKYCVSAYLFPLAGSDPTKEYQLHDSAHYRAFWSIFLLVGVSTVVIGVFLIICGSPFANRRLYKIGGAFFLTGGLCLLAVVVMYVMWTQVLDTLDQYVARRQLSSMCSSDYHMSVHYGTSFLFAPVSIFFLLSASLLFILIGQYRAEQCQRAERPQEVESVQLCKDLDFSLELVSSDL
ncbi:hypothetical protein DPEC_G00152260 [Dallia pectoralis]|uniref:Uncharacterized protein n=1 Tax=Dallia pectoralis TaxID=75939 RepID=A0ACC2GJ97_DALPE|nr:hypothetical protein DPEC_G00152260 [Dallia pectoralis]